MNRLAVSIGVVVVALSAVAIGRLAAQHAAEPAPAAITIDYPVQDSIFPPDMVAPTFFWRDPAKTAAVWRIDIEFADASPAIHLKVPGERMQVGEIDPRAVSSTNEPPKLTPEQAQDRTWKPDPETWALIKRLSVSGKAIVTIAGVTDLNADRVVSRGQVAIQTSRDPVGAPIFYRDVPLMPSAGENGVIKPLAAKAVPLIAWRLRNVSETSSHVMMTGLH